MSVFAKLISLQASLEANTLFLQRNLHLCVPPELKTYYEIVNDCATDASRLNDELLKARLDEQQQKIEALRAEGQPKTVSETLAEISDEFHKRCEELDPMSVCASVERQAWHRALGIIEKYIK